MSDRPALRFGMNLTATHDASSPPHRQLSEHRESIALAKEIGFDLIIAGQHYASPELRYFQPIPYLARLADVTEGMRLAVGIIVLPLHHPLAVAEDIATLDALTGGRAVLGVGIGYSHREFAAFNVDRKTRTRRFEESIGVIRRLLSGETIDHQGEFFELQQVAVSTLPVEPGKLPLWIGAQAEPSTMRAARLGDAWYVPPFPTHRELIQLWRTYEQQRTDLELGLDVELPVRREIFLTDSKDEAREAIAMAERRYEIYAKWGLGLDAAYDEDRWMESRFIVGDAKLVAERLNRLREELPMTHLVYKPQWVGLDHRASLDQLERFGAEVVPLLEA